MRIPLVLAIILMIFSLLVDFYIIYDLRSNGKNRRGWKIYCATSVICWIWLIVIVALPKRSENVEIQGIMWMLYAYLSLYLSKFVYVIFSALGRLMKFLTRKRLTNRPFRWVGLICGMAILVTMFMGATVTRHRIMVTEVSVDSPRVPPAFNGFRIVQLSDLHVGTWGDDTSFIRELVEEVNSLNPDLIVFTGDLVNRKTDELAPFIYELAQLRGKEGVISILGNHDYGDYVDWANPQEREDNNNLLHREQRGMGWDLLQDEHRLIIRGNDTIVVAGVENWGDAPFPTYGSLEKALPDSRDSLINRHDNHFKILLSHNPEHWNREVSSGSNIDLTLSGHTHAMQMMVGSLDGWKWSPAVYRYPLWGGMYEREGDDGHPVRLYVNIGAGEVGMPARLLGARPEVTLIVLHHTEGNE